MMEVQPVEIQKARYSQELAEYTMRQYDAARQSLDAKGGHSRSSNVPSPTQDGGNTGQCLQS
jgi:hypothetical protein